MLNNTLGILPWAFKLWCFYACLATKLILVENFWLTQQLGFKATQSINALSNKMFLNVVKHIVLRFTSSRKFLSSARTD